MSDRFPPGERVRMSEWALSQAPRQKRAEWAARIGTVTATGSQKGALHRVYVRWDGNASESQLWVTWLRPVADEWAIEPATTG